MDALMDRIRREVQRVLRLRAEPRMARITSFDPKTHAIKAAVLPEADFPIEKGDVAETGWIPHGPVAGGNGWGIYAPPLPGTQIMLAHQEGAPGAAVGITTVNDQGNPPPGALAGEIWLVHSSTKTTIKLTNDTNALIELLQGNLAISVTTGLCNISVKGDVTVSTEGNATISANGNANLLAAAQVHLGTVGGRKVARDGDAVSTGGVVIASSANVYSA